MRLLLVRHGQTEWNLQHRIQGQLNSPLTAKGLFQADRAGIALSNENIHRFYCSDTGRAVQSAERMLKANPSLPLPQPDARLRELDYGDWEGMLNDEIMRAYPELYWAYRNDPESFRAPNGESFADMQARFSGFFTSTSFGDEETCLIVSHAGLLRIAMLTLMASRIEEMKRMPPIPEASISIMQREHGTSVLGRSCDTRHLEQPDGEDPHRA